VRRGYKEKTTWGGKEIISECLTTVEEQSQVRIRPITEGHKAMGEGEYLEEEGDL